MSHRKHPLALMCMCLVAAVGLMGFGAAAAQATANIKINGKEVKEAVLLENLAPGTLTLNVPALNLQVECPGIKFDKGDWLLVNLPPPVPIFDFVIILFGSGCRPLIGGKESSCKVAPFEATVKGAGFLHEGKTYERFEPEGTKLTTLHFSGEGCSLAKELVLSGKFVTESPTIETESVTQKLFPLKTGLFSDELKLGTNTATFEATEGLGLMLAAPNEGAKWSITA
jgi:hypothetical protein